MGTFEKWHLTLSQDERKAIEERQQSILAHRIRFGQTMIGLYDSMERMENLAWYSVGEDVKKIHDIHIMVHIDMTFVFEHDRRYSVSIEHGEPWENYRIQTSYWDQADGLDNKEGAEVFTKTYDLPIASTDAETIEKLTLEWIQPENRK